jgi:hypothetical protein
MSVGVGATGVADGGAVVGVGDMTVADGGRVVSVGGEAVAVGGSGLSVAARAIRVVVAGTDAVVGSELVQPVVKSAINRISASTLVQADMFIAFSSHHQ